MVSSAQLPQHVLCATAVDTESGERSPCRLVQVAASNYVPPTLLEPAEADTLPLVTPESAVASILSAADQYDGPDCAPRQFDGYPGVAYINQQNMLGLYRILAHQVCPIYIICHAALKTLLHL